MKGKLQKHLAIALTLLFALCSVVSLSAQTNSLVSGVVVDESGNAVIAATVVLRDNPGVGTVTDMSGAFSISVPSGSTLVVSYLGMTPQEIAVGTRTHLSVTLASDTQAIEEVVVVGYGQQKKVSSVGSIATTKGDDLLSTGGVSSVSGALQGQMAGVVAVNSTGKPGSETADIYIRGKSSTSDNTPLCLVDGVERDIDDIDMNEVESVSVLKDASATAVYGVKGANGVILVTTKRGTNSRPQIGFSSSVGFKQPTTSYDFSDYVTSMEAYNQAQVNDGNWGSLISQATIDAWSNAYATGNYGAYNDIFPEVNWSDAMTKDFGVSHNYNLNVRGGTERMSYFASLGYLFDGDIYVTEKQEEYDPRYYYKRYNWRTNFDYKLSKSTKISFNIAGSLGYQNQPGYANGDGTLFNNVFTSENNTYPIMYSNGVYGTGANDTGNVVAMLNGTGQRTYKTFKGMYDLSIKQDLDFITKGLSASAKVSYNSTAKNESAITVDRLLESRTYDYENPTVDQYGNITYNTLTVNRLPEDYPLIGDLPATSSYNAYSSSSRQLYYEASISYAREFGEHDVTALGLFNRRIEQSNVAFPSYEEDWVGRVTYGYKDKYLTEVNAAYTGSEKFAPGRRFGFFPSFSVGWRPTEEAFMHNIRDKWLSNMKIRYSWGKVGSDNGAARFNYIQEFSSSSNVSFGATTNNTTSTIYTEGTLANEAATWEESIKQNLGLEMTICKKLFLTLDLYDEYRTGILSTLTNFAPWIGIGLPSDNIGITKNHGLEFEATWRDRIGKDFNYNVTFNVGASENRIIYNDDALDADWYTKDEGKSIGYNTAYITSGNYSIVDDIYNSPISGISGVTTEMLVPGDLMYYDYNCDGQISTLDLVPSQYNDYPVTTYSLTFGFNWRNFGFSAMFYAATGVYKDNIQYLLYDFPANYVKTQTDVVNTWSYNDAQSTEIIRPSLHLASGWNKLTSNYNYTDHSYLRLKNLEVSYVLPKSWTSKVSISRCQVYANGSNLLTWQRNDSQRDPETSSHSVYPMVKRYNLGVRITFE